SADIYKNKDKYNLLYKYKYILLFIYYYIVYINCYFINLNAAKSALFI
ncbi:MAG: hypothetical protein H6Q67_1626, partial [Firmicutes bacterium]|nr:hypothetical protein [Bacillota bacterium]